VTAKTSRSWPGALAAGVIGGAVAALALTWALPRDSAEIVALRAQVDRLEQAQAGVAGQDAAVARLTTRLEALEGGEGGEEIRGQIEALKAADAALQKRLDSLEPGAAGAQLKDLTARLDQLDAAVAAARSSGGTSAAVTERLAELENKLGALSTTVAQRPRAPAGGRTELADLTSRIGDLEARLDQAEGARQEVEGLAGRLGAVTQQIVTGQEQTAGLNDKVAALGGEVGALTTRVDSLSGTVDRLEQQVTGQRDRRTRAATLALTVAQLGAALDAGEPVEPALDGLRALGADDPAVIKAVETLQAAAAANAPSLPALRDSFERIANEVVHAEQAPDGNSLLDQAAGNLMRLVTVRPIGADVEGDSAAARVARAEAALVAGDLAAAVIEVEALEGAAAQAAAPWLAAARARLAVQAAQAALQEQATRLLSSAQ
jgi:hypothetical protein